MKNQKRTPEQIAEDNKERIRSDAKFVDRGARVNDDGSLDVAGMVDVIDSKKEEMEFDLYAREVGKVFERDEIIALVGALEKISQARVLNAVEETLLVNLKKVLILLN